MGKLVKKEAILVSFKTKTYEMNENIGSKPWAQYIHRCYIHSHDGSCIRIIDEGPERFIVVNHECAVGWIHKIAIYYYAEVSLRDWVKVKKFGV